MKRLVIAILSVLALVLPAQAAVALPTTYDATIFFTTVDNEPLTPGARFEITLTQPSGAVKQASYTQTDSLNTISRVLVPDLEAGKITWAVDIYIPNKRQEDPDYATGTFENAGGNVRLSLNDRINLDTYLNPLAGNPLKGRLTYFEPSDADMEFHSQITDGPGLYRFTTYKSSEKLVLQYVDFSTAPHIVGYPTGAHRQHDARIASATQAGPVVVVPEKQASGKLNLTLKDAYGKTPQFKLIAKITPLAADIPVQSSNSQVEETVIAANTSAVTYPLKAGRYSVEVQRIVNGVYRTLYTSPEVLVKDGKTSSLGVKLDTQAVNRKSAGTSKVTVKASGITSSLKSTVRLVSKKNTYVGTLSKNKKTFTRVEPGKYKVYVDGFVQPKSVTVTKNKTATVPTFKATTGKAVSGTVRSAKKVTVKKTTVELVNAKTQKVISTTKTDSKGKYVFAGVKKGNYTVRAWAAPDAGTPAWNTTKRDALAAGYRNATVKVGAKSVRKNVTLRAVSTVNGVVVDSTGAPVPNFAVKLTAKGHQSQTAYTNAQGKFSFKNVSRTSAYFLVSEPVRSSYGFGEQRVKRSITKSTQSVKITVK